MTNAQTEARAIAERFVEPEYEQGRKALAKAIATALSAKDAELAELRKEVLKVMGGAACEEAQRLRAEAQLAEARKALDAAFEDTQARTKAGMVYGINGHPTLSPATLSIVAQARFTARRAREAQGGENNG